MERSNVSGYHNMPLANIFLKVMLLVGIDDQKKLKVAIKMISKKLVEQIDRREGN
jgi:hypothetical protein